MAIASENSERIQLNSLAIGIWKTPNDARIAKFTRMITQPTIKTGVNRELCVFMFDLSGLSSQDVTHFTKPVNRLPSFRNGAFALEETHENSV